MVTTTVYFYEQAGADDAEYYGNPLAWNNSRNYINVGTHSLHVRGPWAGFRFLIDEDIDPDTITEAHLHFNGNATGANLEGTIRVESGPAAQWADNSTDRPNTRYTAAPSANQVYWYTTPTAGNWSVSPDISAGVKVALSNINKGEYLGVTIGNNGSSSGVNFAQIISQDHSTSNRRPYLSVTYEIDPVNALVETVAPVLDMSLVDGISPVGYHKHTNISYHDGLNSNSRRSLDVYTPLSPPPPEGYPIVLFLHGGAWASGNKSDIRQAPEILQDTLDCGIAVVSINYKFIEGNALFNLNTGFSRPSFAQDCFAALKWIKGNAETYDLDYNSIVALGYSAGAHMALELALMVNDPGRDTYELKVRGQSSQLGTRYPDFPDNIVTGGRSMNDIPPVRGSMSVAGPISLRQIFIDGNVLLAPFISMLFGLGPNDGYSNNLDREGDLNSYIMGSEGTIYESKGPTTPSFHIGAIFSTIDVVVPKASGHDLLVSALDTVSYPVSEISGEVLEGAGYSWWGEPVDDDLSGGHNTVFRRYDREFLRNWYTEVFSKDVVEDDGWFFFM